jgi:ubiquinone/menaquinone biosynthesis C-methylase UbiE
MPDELAHAGPEHLDPGFVAGYDRKQGHPSPAEDIEALAAYGALGPTVVDLGTGTGRFAVAAAEHAARVVAVDVSAAMLEHVRATASSTVEVVRAGFLSYQHTGAPADAVYTRNALHQLPDFWKGVALDRISRFLRPGGILRLRDLVYDFEPAQAAEIFADWYDGAATDPADGYTAADFADHIRTEHSTYRWLLEPMLERTGFEILAVEYHGKTYAAYTCRRR